MFADPFQATAPTEIYNAPQRLTERRIEAPVSRTAQIPTQGNEAAGDDELTLGDECGIECEVSEEASAQAKQFSLFPLKVRRTRYELLKKLLPEFFEDTEEGQYLNNMLCLMFALVRWDDESDGLIISAELVASVAGRKRGGTFRAIDWLRKLQRFEERGLYCEIKKAEYQRGRARTLVITWSSEIEKAFAEEQWNAGAEAERYPEKRPDKVYLATGEPFSIRKEKKERADLNHRREEMENALPAEAMQKPLLALLNSHLNKRAQAIHTALKPGLEAAVKYLDTLCREETRWNWDYMSTLIDSFRSPYPEWMYCPSEKTTRCHAIGPNAHLLPRAVRKELFAHLYTFDLKSSQLAGAAALWGAEVVRARLERCTSENEDIWEYLIGQSGLHGDDVVSRFKPIFKKPLYGCAFGQLKVNMKRNLIEALTREGLTEKGAETAAAKFLDCPEMKDLIDARKRRMNRIVAEGGLRLPSWTWDKETHEGAWLPLEETLEGTEEAGEQARKVRSLLAQELQALELSIMLAAANVIKRNPTVVIVSWLHDGFTLHFSDESKREKITKSILSAVAKACKAANYPSYLSAE